MCAVCFLVVNRLTDYGMVSDHFGWRPKTFVLGGTTTFGVDFLRRDIRLEIVSTAEPLA